MLCLFWLTFSAGECVYRVFLGGSFTVVLRILGELILFRKGRLVYSCCARSAAVADEKVLKVLQDSNVQSSVEPC